MSVTAAAGFTAAAVTAGLKDSGGLDLALVVNHGPSYAAACVFTGNRAKANPILWSTQAVADGIAHAIVLNAGGANCFTGAAGFETSRATAEAAAAALGTHAQNIIVCSTGMIGETLDRGKVVDGVTRAAAAQSDDGVGAARAILTTDTHPKTAVRRAGGFTIGAMAKGAGMLAPGLATMLVVITTDARLAQPALEAALREATRLTFNRLDSDGCMSTNDQVTLLASGASGVDADPAVFTAELTALCADLAAQLQADAEGAAHEITVTVTGAATEDDAVEVARAVARSNLFKTAVFGNDPNWGRVLAAIGTTKAPFDPYEVDVSMNGVRVCHAGAPDRPRDEVDLMPRVVQVLIELHAGQESAAILTNDLTHDYVHENSAYSS